MRSPGNALPEGGFTAGETYTLDRANAAPAVSSQSFTIEDGVPLEAEVGAVVATDANSGDPLTFSLTGTAFAIHPTSGMITVAQTLDAGTQGSYSLTVTVTDGAGASTTSTITITVTVTATPNPVPALVKDINVASSASSPGSNPQLLTTVGTRVFFAATDSTHGAELWKTDGTTAGTALVKDINPGAGSGLDGAYWPMTANGVLLFRATDGSHGYDLWRSDGTESGTQLYDLTGDSRSSYPTNFRRTGNRLFFSATSPVCGTELYSMRFPTVDLGNSAPTGLDLSDSTIPENQPAGTEVGRFSTTDPDAANTFTYTLVAGGGSADNSAFTLSGNRLLTAAAFNYETRNFYSIRVCVTDQGGLTLEAVFTITVDNVTPETFTVSTANNSGPGSMRQTLLDANACGSASAVIEFSPGLGTLAPSTPLPDPTLPIRFLTAGGSFALEQNGNDSFLTFTPANHAPVVAQPATAATRQGQALVLTAAKLLALARPTDADGDPLTFDGVAPGSANGAVTLVANVVTYTPIPAFSGTDTFVYSIGDGRGGTALASVTVTVNPTASNSANVVAGPVLDGTDFVVQFAGIPGFSYTIEATDTLSPANWQKKRSFIAPATSGVLPVGIYELRDPTDEAPTRYYRTVWPAY
jgi:ELWxxDGT repeat protein/VCBS repeat-containing protein